MKIRAMASASAWIATVAQVLTGAASAQELASSVQARPEDAPGSRAVDSQRLALGGACPPSWVSTFGHVPGTSGTVYGLTVFDDGGGPALYVGGNFTRAGGAIANHVARWDGTEWSTLGSGMNGSVRELVVYDDGGGPDLYACGFFTTAGGAAANRIARWDGTSWSALGSGMNDAVRFLAVHDDGTGAALYAGGSFTTAGGAAANRIAKWDGTSWSPLGGGVNDNVFALAVYDHGNGPALYVGGTFDSAGGMAANRIAKWDGASWSALNSAMDGNVYALKVYDDGSGERLYAGGNFTTINASGRLSIAAWNGFNWSSVGSGIHSNIPGVEGVTALAVYDDGGGDALLAGGDFSVAGGRSVWGIAKWNGTSWSSPGLVIEGYTVGSVKALAEYDDGGGPALFVGGEFDSYRSSDTSPRVLAGGIARWSGSDWSRVGNGMDPNITSLTAHDDGSGPALYAGGDFEVLQGDTMNRIAKWDGVSWSPLGSGIGGAGSEVIDMTVYDDGGGPALFAGGTFTTAGGVTVNRIAKWDGASWSMLGGGMNSSVWALTVFDDGSGPALYAGGSFTTAGGVAANRIAKWDGSSWAALGSGVAVGSSGGGVVALTVFDDGSGPALFAAGQFTAAGGLAVNNIAKWDGASWSRLGAGIAGYVVLSLAVYDDGSGPALYAGGQFDRAGGQLANQVAKWDGTSWSTLGGGVSDPPPGLPTTVYDLAAHDDGTGPALFAAGIFTVAGGVMAASIAKWDGASWSALGGGLIPYSIAVRGESLLVYEDGTGPSLFVSGVFVAPDSGDAFLAKWGHAADLEPPVLSCPPSVFALDPQNSPPGEVVTFSVTASDCRDPAPDVVSVPPSGSLFPPGTTLVTSTATDASGNQSTCQFPVTVKFKTRRR